MSHKKAKKIRKIYGKEVKRLSQKDWSKHILKPKPRFMPHWFWRFIYKIVLDIK